MTTKEKQLQEEILEKFLKQGYSPYGLHIHFDIPLKTVYHVIRLSEEAKSRHKKAVYKRKELEKVS